MQRMVSGLSARDAFKILPPVRRRTTGLLRGLFVAAVFLSIGALVGQRIGS